MYQYFTESGETYQETLEKVKSRYGDKAQIMGQRTVAQGGFLGFFQREAIELSGYIKHDNGPTAADKAKLEEEKQKILALAQAKSLATARAQQAEEKKDDSMKAVLEEFKALQAKIDQLPDKMTFNEAQAKVLEHPTVARLAALLDENDFSPAYTKMILDRLKKEFTMADLENPAVVEPQVLAWIAGAIELHQEGKVGKPRIFILVGPTGVGKTTTIAKLAAVYGLGFGGQERQKLSLITIDNYRIGAKMQIESYGEIMGIPVTCVESFDALRQRIELDSDKDMILIDTIGKSPKDYVKLAEMRRLLEGTGRSSEVHLAVSATTKTRDIRDIFQQFEPFGYQSVVLTKLDETSVVGNLLSLLWEKQKPVSFLTDGQSVPQDIHRASKEKLLKPLVGFPPELILQATKE